MKKNLRVHVLGILICVLSVVGCQKKEEIVAAKPEVVKLSPINGEQIFNRYQDAVVLIKHSFVYKISIDGEDYFFKDYDKTSGDISEFISYEEAQAEPNVSWGTGFFIDNQGTLLTNRHVVDVRPSEQEGKLILSGIKSRLENMYYAGVEDYQSKRSDFERLQYNNYNSGGYGEYVSEEDMESMRTVLDGAERKLNALGSFIDNFESLKNRVTKTSLQFGVFFNNQKSSTLNDYVQYKSIKISENPDVDLALMKPVNAAELTGRKIVSADMSKIDSVQIKPLKITEKVTMLGYNHGIAIGQTTGGMKPQLTEGNISQVTDENKILYTIPAMPGSSGSPVFDKFGRLVAVNFAGMTGTQSFNYGIQTQQISNFIKNTP